MLMTRSLVWIIVAVVTAQCNISDARAQTATDDAGFASMYGSGQSAMAAGRFDEALVDFERMEKMDPSVAEVHVILGILDYKLEDFDRAIEEIQAARKLKPELRGLDRLLSLSLAETGRYSEVLLGLQNTAWLIPAMHRRMMHSDPIGARLFSKARLHGICDRQWRGQHDREVGSTLTTFSELPEKGQS